jgi:hypothetical protein
MYGTTALLELDRPDIHLSEPEGFYETEGFSEPEGLLEPEAGHRVERFLWAVSSGWPQVLCYLESCDLDREAREILRHLRQDEWQYAA